MPTLRAVVCGRTSAPDAFSSLAKPITRCEQVGPAVVLGEPEAHRHGRCAG